ncbi:DUF222 domain-containing protein [Nocardioides sp. R1-1]|uniref:HNH endonuclease signature motif containing protein n=1 Tax=Nocardioides sp. R1-1 TaxID=3383502 RepID=UPI0038D232CF
MSTATLAPPHPMVGCASELCAALDRVAQVQPVYMTTGDKERALVELARAKAKLAEVEARILAASDDIAVEHGARDVADWLAHATRADARTVRADLRLATALQSRPAVAAGMAAGAVSAAQARVIVTAVEELPVELGAELAAEAERTLVGYAEHHTPRELRRLGRRILEVVAPEVAEAEEGRRLEAEERRARERASLRFRDLADGRTRVWGMLPTSVAQRLEHYLQAFTAPRQRQAGDERVPQHRAYADAFASLLELLDPDRLPEHGGDATTVLVTMTLDQLRAELAAADVIVGDGSEAISAAEARRLACQASIIPVVLGGRSEVLDLGRSRRLHSRAQRRALRLRDRGCRAEGCTVPAAWTEAHHLRPWSQGGATTLDEGIALCSHHHRRAHDRSYTQQILANGDVRFHRRT